MKDHILANIFVELSPVTNSLLENEESASIELEDLFQTDDEEYIFEGFDTSLNTIFKTDDDDVIFEGFETSLNTLLQSDSEENEDFHGF